MAENLNTYSSASLAYLGDCTIELCVREYLVREKGFSSSAKLNKKKYSYKSNYNLKSTDTAWHKDDIFLENCIVKEWTWTDKGEDYIVERYIVDSFGLLFVCRENEESYKYNKSKVYIPNMLSDFAKINTADIFEYS